jgi:hypothetical protein
VALDLLAENALEDRPLPDVGAQDAGYFDRRNVIGALEDHARGRPMELDDDERRLLDAWIAAVEVPAERFDALARRRAEVAGRRLLELHEADPRQVRPADAAEAGAPAVRIVFEAIDED